MRSYSYSEYVKAGCTMGNVLVYIHRDTYGKVCDTGCTEYNDGRCPAFIKLTSKTSEVDINQETVKEEAKRRHVSIKQVRTERRDKEYAIRNIT